MSIRLWRPMTRRSWSPLTIRAAPAATAVARYHVVIGISGHARAERGGLDDSNAKSQLFQERQGGRTERELAAQGALEFVEQGG